MPTPPVLSETRARWEGLRRSRFPPPSVDEKALKISFVVLLAALAAIFPLSVAAAFATGFDYGQLATQSAYPTLAKGLAPVLGAAVLGLILSAHSRRSKIDAIERSLLRFLESRGLPSQEWDEDLEEVLRSRADLGQYGRHGEEIQRALSARNELQRAKAWAARLLALPVLGLTLIVGLSLWAVPASEGFLLHQDALNTTLLFFTSYGTVVAMASLVAAFLLVRQE